MANYEIMLVLDGSLSIEQAQESINELVSIIDKSENYKFTDLGNRDLSYKIKNQTKGWYFQYNFSTNDSNVINEFRRLATINKNVLRQLIINLDKDYGARALMNSKKVAKSEIKFKRFSERMEKYRQEKFERESAVKELEQINAIKPEESTNE
jgi:small subunit ribosomal protein S6